MGYLRSYYIDYRDMLYNARKLFQQWLSRDSIPKLKSLILKSKVKKVYICKPKKIVIPVILFSKPPPNL